jgi:glycosyltransferase involved in cell wall biosynthesis
VSERSRPRILVIAYDFPPHAAIGTMRTLRVVRRLSAMGWDVTVLTSDPARFRPSTPSDPALLTQVPEDVTVLRAGPLRLWEAAFQAIRNRGGARPTRHAAAAPRVQTGTGPPGLLAAAKNVVDAALSIPDREIGWLLPAVWTGMRHRFRSGAPDVIYSSAPPWTGQLVALGLRGLLRRPWVADFRDPWSRAPWRGDRYRFAIRAAAFLEGRVIRRADRIVFVAEGNRDDFATHYGPRMAAKFHLVPNGCDPAEFDAIEPPTAAQSGMHVMLHAGSLYAGRTPVPVLRGVARAIDAGLLDRSRFRLQFLGTNIVGTDLVQACRDLRIDDVVDFLPRVPRQEGLRAMLSATSLLLLQPGHTVSVPGKVYEYLAAGRPIFALAEGETADVVRRSGIGIAVTSDDESLMVDGLMQVVRMSQGEVPKPPREMYDGNLGAAAIEDLLRQAIAHAPAYGANLTEQHRP